MFLLLTSWTLLAWLFCKREYRQHQPFSVAFRYSILYAIISITLLIFAYTELSSLLDGLSHQSALVYWVCVNMVLIGLVSYDTYTSSDNYLFMKEIGVWYQHSKVDVQLRYYSAFSLIVLILPLLWLALTAPPSNNDSNDYHLFRIISWIQNHNVEHYPTMYVQQLYHNLMGEFMVLTTFLLSDTDHFANLPQYSCFLGSLVAISLLAREFGLSRRGQFIALFLLLSLPIGLFESTTTQVDYIACFFFLCFLGFGYATLDRHDNLTLLACIFSLAAGCFTKYTIFLFGTPYALYFGLGFIRRRGYRYGLQVLSVSLVAFMVLFGPFWTRNYRFFGSILGPTRQNPVFSEKLPTDRFSVAYTCSNVLKNIGLHTGLPLPPYNRLVDACVNKIHGVLGVSIDDPAITCDHFRSSFSMTEDTAPNTLHLFLLFFSSLILISRRGYLPAKLLLLFAIIGFLVFSSVLKFQNWSSRTQMPFFAVGCVLIAFVYEAILKQRRLYPVTLLSLMAAIVVYGNPAKAIIPFRYTVKRAIAHVPYSLYTADTVQNKQFVRLFSDFYNTTLPYSEKGYPLRRSYTFRERLTLFNRLDSMGYYDADKRETILSQSRAESIFWYHPFDYKAFAQLIPHIPADCRSVGVLVANYKGFYHYWSVLAEKLGHPVDMAYILYSKEYTKLPNASRPFSYRTILSNNYRLVRRLIPAERIDSIYQQHGLVVVTLKESQRVRYVY